MPLRLRLAVAFLLLSVLPLGGFAVYSYTSSRAALREAARAEAEIAAAEIESRVAGAAVELGDRFGRLAQLPREVAGEPPDAARAELERTLAGVAPALPFLEGVEFVPLPAPAPPAPATPAAAEEALSPATIARILDSVAHAGAAVESGDFARLAGAAAEPAERERLRAELERVRAEVAESLRQAREVQRLHERHVTRPTPPAPPVDGAPPVDATPAIDATPVVAPSERDELSVAVAAGDRVIGRIRARLKADDLLRSVLERTDRRRGEIPFALDAEGRLHAASDADRERLEQLPELAAVRAGDAAAPAGDWVVTTQHDPASGLRFGIARPLGAAIGELKAATARNFSLGVGLVALAAVAFFPLTRRIVADVRELERGAVRLAGGDLGARVAVRGGDELGRLAGAFNRMAEQIAAHQRQLVADERRRKEDEIARRLLEAENERRGRELEEAREFQLSLLPRELPSLAGFDLAVEMTTATEVGGDYYDFQRGAGGALVLAIGDATGHGAAAGTLVTAVKSLFAAAAVESAPAAFLTAGNGAIHRMGLVRRAMALAVGRVEGARVTVSSAGMPPILHFVAGERRVDEIVLPGTPLGARADFPYGEVELELQPGDALLFLSDGLPELPDAGGEPFGYERLRRSFAELAPSAGAAEIIAGLRAAAERWSGDRRPVDDLTLLVLRRRVD